MIYKILDNMLDTCQPMFGNMPTPFRKAFQLQSVNAFQKCLCNSGKIRGTHQTRFEKLEQIICGNHEEAVVLETNRKPEMC